MEGTEYNAQTTLASDLSLVIAHEEPSAINYVMSVKPCAVNAVKTAQIHSSWYEENARTDLVQRNSDPPLANISVGNATSQCMFASLILCITLSQ
jgi:hypothetical protein